MGERIPTPEKSWFDKRSFGRTDVTISNNVYKLLGATLIGVDGSLGYNGQASSLTVRLVEDTEDGDNFIQPTIPSWLAVSLPKGGTNSKLFHEDGYSLKPNQYYPTNVPFYFCGIVTGWRRTKRDVSGKTIEVRLADPREILSGVQVLTGGFSLSQNIGTGSPRFQNVENVIDAFGYFDYGMESDRNEMGMPWSKILSSIEASRITVNDLKSEFHFTGSAFRSAPDWYRIKDETIDLVGLCQKVASDGGSDFIAHARKVDDDIAVIEMRSIKRDNDGSLTEGEIDSFINQRSNIVEAAELGREYRSEPTSSIIIGGRRNKNYGAWPSSYSDDFHFNDDSDAVDYQSFSLDIKDRVFSNSSRGVEAGSIFPYWGFDDDFLYPLAEPFVSMEHLAFDKDAKEFARLKSRIPLCKFKKVQKEVREVNHDDMFLDGDGGSDFRPWSIVDEIKIGVHPSQEGFVRGMPVPTQALRAAQMSQEAFELVYRAYYPKIADELNFRTIDWHALSLLKIQIRGDNVNNWWEQVNINEHIAVDPIVLDSGRRKEEFTDDEKKEKRILHSFRKTIFETIRKYADERMGRQWLVVLPRSTIMRRIFNGETVPTRKEKPTIEYSVSNAGYWEVLPSEFDGLSKDSDTQNEEQQVRERFMQEDGRFQPMAFVDWKPKGNISFRSNGKNRILFQDLPVDDFRPNRIESETPEWVAVACNVTQLQKRPDLALVTMPPVRFDPVDSVKDFETFKSGEEYRIRNVNMVGAYELFKFMFDNDNIQDPNYGPKNLFDSSGNADEAFKDWGDRTLISTNVQGSFSLLDEVCYDLKAITIPLTSNWVTYGPWFYTNEDAKGMVDVQVDEELVPWNFERPGKLQSWDKNLNEAGIERLKRSLADIDYLDSASVTVAGFPEYVIGDKLGHNSNITEVSISMQSDGITTTYQFKSFYELPDTFRKSDFDRLRRVTTKAKDQLPDADRPTQNVSLFKTNEDHLRNSLLSNGG